MKCSKATILLCIIMCFISTSPYFPQEKTNENDYIKQFRDILQKKYFTLNLGVQLRNQLYLPEEGESLSFKGLELHRIRTKLSGQLDDNISYLYQIDYVNTVKLFDARVGYKFSSEFIIEVGQFKTGYSREWLLPFGKLNFSDRARIVNLLSPKRQIGIQLRGELSNLTYMFGLYNGNGTNVSPDSRASMLTGRLTVKPLSSIKDINMDIGVNGAFSDDSNDKFAKSANLNSEYSKRVIAGIDFNFKYDLLVLTGEYHKGWLKSQNDEVKPWGAFLDLNFKTCKSLNLILRGDFLKESAEFELSTLGQIGLIYKISEISLIRASFIKDLNKSRNSSLDRAEVHLQFFI